MADSLFLQLAILVAAAKIGGELFERWLKQPAVLGEIVFGVLIGKSCLRWVQSENHVILGIAEIGAVLLLFEVGLESDISELFRVGASAMFVAIVGVAAPMALGWITADAMGLPTMESMFVGAALTATSVGITARVFSDLRATHLVEAKIVLGAAVIDDILGLIILAAVTSIVNTHAVDQLSIAKLVAVAILFLVAAIFIGLRATPLFLRLARKMQTRAAVSSAAVIFCFLLAALANKAQLAPIVGAFAAGIVLAKTQEKIHFEDKVRSIADLFVPVFFVTMGARMDLEALSPATVAGRQALICGGILVVVAVIGKLLAGLTVPTRGVRRWLIGIGMIPRGEVGLIFASIGLSTGVITEALYSALIFVVIVTTFVTPPLLTSACKAADGGSAEMMETV